MRSLTALLLTSGAGVLLVSYHWQRLPERVASHFDSNGIVNGWMSKDANFFLSAGILIGLTAVFYLLGVMMRRLPERWFNLPNKAHWLAADRETQTRSYLSAWFWSFGAVLNVFFLFIFHMVYLAHTTDPVAINNTTMVAGLLVYLMVALGSVVTLLVRFRKGS